MKNLRQRTPFKTKAFRFAKRHDANAVMRAFGNSIDFPWSTVTRDFSRMGDLKDCSLIFFDVEEDSVIDVLNSFEYDELIFSRMAGRTVETSPFTCLISRHDILHCYEQHLNDKS